MISLATVSTAQPPSRPGAMLPLPPPQTIRAGANPAIVGRELAGEGFRFILVRGADTRSLRLPANAHHFVAVVLDGFGQGRLTTGSFAAQGRVEAGDIGISAADASAEWQWSGRINECLHIYLEPAWLQDRLVRQARAEDPREQCGAAGLQPAFRRTDALMLALARAMRDEITHSGPYAGRVADSAAVMLGAHLFRNYAGQPAPAEEDSETAQVGGGLARWQLRRVIAAMEESLDEAISLTELGALVGLSAAHLCTAFRESTGLPPRRWLMQRRLERAKRMLANPHLPLTEIALNCGYGSSSHFSTSFRRATGMKPTDYRRRL